tara:strand:- start:2542 stop:6177 length:3636 start_codon:yes stop_codon:yes gene_type:complete
MATVTNKSYKDLIPIRFILEDPDRALDLSIPGKFTSQQGASFLEYNFLLSANDVKNKNYTTNYLTSPLTEQGAFDLKLPEPINDSIATTLKFSLSSDRYLTIDKNNTSLSSSAFFSILSGSAEDNNATQNFVVDLSAKADGTPLCQIWTRDGEYKKYLVQNNGVVTDSISLIFDTITTPSDNRSIFNIIQNNDKILLSIYDSNNENIALSGQQYIVGPVLDGSVLTLSAAIATSQIYRDSIIEVSDNAIDTDYVKSSNNFVFYLSGNEVDTTETLAEQAYNFIFYNNYEDNYLSGDEIVGKLNYFNLKNQISNNNNVNKNLPHADPQQQKYYTNILNNETQETSEEDLKLGYNFYTAEYSFLPDKYTKFKLPQSILPFKALNINDSDIQKSGSFASQSPYFSDRVYKTLDKNVNYNEQNGSLLCTWLYDDGVDGLWYDRYYLPQNVSELSASRGNLNQVFNYISEVDTIVAARDKENLDYYDIESSLTFEPSGTYYYARIGEKYIKKILDTQSDVRLKSGLTPINLYTQKTAATTSTMVFDTSSYDTFKFDTGATSKVNSLNLSFEVNTPKLESFKGYQVIGNNYNSGISVIKNFYPTPFITLQQDNTIFFYDTDFNLIRETSFPDISAIKDICYVAENTDLILRCGSITGGKLLRVNIAGDIIKENNDEIAQDLANSNITSRIFYGAGNLATFQGRNTGVNAWNVDLLTLVAEIAPIVVGEDSVVRRLDSTITSTMSGLRGVNLNDTLGAAISGHNTVIFKDFNDSITFAALNTDTKIWDINAFDEKLYVQTDNKLKVFDTNRELLSTFSLTTSAVSGYKIDFISEDYKVKPIVLSRGSDYKLIVDKIDTHVNNSSGYEITTYNLDISSVDLGYDFNATPGVFVSPTNLYSANQTYKKYENKLCLVTRFDNSFSVLPTERIWNDTNTDWDSVSAGNWSVNYSNAGGGLTDNSKIIEISNLDKNSNCISIDADLITGQIKVYVNGKKTNEYSIATGIKPLKNYLSNNFLVGAPNYGFDTVTRYVKNQELLAKNGSISHLSVYTQELNDDLIMYEALKCSRVDPVVFDILTGTRINTETIDNLFSYKIPGSLSNRIKIYIKNGNLKNADAIKIVEVLAGKIGEFLPMNITTVDYDFSIGNQIEDVIEANVSDATSVSYGNVIRSAGPGELGSIAPTPGVVVGEPTFGPIYDYVVYEDGTPALDQDGLFIYVD